MKTLKLHITHLDNEDFVHEKQLRFSNALVFVYNRLDESEDKEFIRRVMERFQLNDIEYRSVKAAAKAAREQDLTRDKQLQERIQSISEDLLNNEMPIHKRFKMFNRIQRLTRRIGKPQVFGGVQTLRELARECNKSVRDEAKVDALRNLYHDKRLQPLFVVGEFRQWLEWEAKKHDCYVCVADKWFASSKTCHECGHKNESLALSDRVWTCPSCGAELDRDRNAAINLRKWFEEIYNTAGTAGIHACGDFASTLRDCVGRALSMKQDARDFSRG